MKTPTSTTTAATMTAILGSKISCNVKDNDNSNNIKDDDDEDDGNDNDVRFTS